MRIGIDCYGLQNPTTARRGIGRFTRNLITNLVTKYQQHEFILYIRGAINTPDYFYGEENNYGLRTFASVHDNVKVSYYEEIPGNKERSLENISNNPDNLDWFIVTDPHESYTNRKITGCLRASILYDTIPDLIPDLYLNNSALRKYSDNYKDYHQALLSYDKLLAISSSTAETACSFRNHKISKIHIIGCACDETFKPRPAHFIYPEWLKEHTREKPYILHVGGSDPRKGGYELLEAFARLDMRFRTRFNLIYVYECSPSYMFEINKTSNLRGISSTFKMLGYVSDSHLLDLYQNAYVFVLPSKAEGFGLPILESIKCGIPVIAGNNTSQPEIVGQSGLLVDASSPDSISNSLAQILEKPEYRNKFVLKTHEQANKFSWDKVSHETMLALSRVQDRKGKEVIITGNQKPELAFLGLVPPTLSGVTPYSLRLAKALKTHYKVTFWHDPKVTPDLEKWPIEGLTFLPINQYQGCIRNLTQMGNSSYHRWMVDFIEKRGGVVTLHDARLEGLKRFLHTVGDRRWKEWFEFLAPMHDNKMKVIVHSYHAKKFLDLYYPGNAEVIPFGADINTPGYEEIKNIRKSFGWLDESVNQTRKRMYIGTGGFVGWGKMHKEIIASFKIAHDVLLQYGIDPILLIIGECVDGGETKDFIKNLYVPNVYFTGRLDHDKFLDAMSVLDFSIQLRQDEDNGETSAALMDSLCSGVPSIVREAGSFGEFPSSCVIKLNPKEEVCTQLMTVMINFARDNNKRANMSQECLKYIKNNHSWDKIALMYRDIIENHVSERVDT